MKIVAAPPMRAKRQMLQRRTIWYNRNQYIVEEIVPLPPDFCAKIKPRLKEARDTLAKFGVPGPFFAYLSLDHGAYPLDRLERVCGKSAERLSITHFIEHPDQPFSEPR
jgi:hypothetical protein